MYGIRFNITGNRLDDTSSNPGQGCLCFSYEGHKTISSSVKEEEMVLWINNMKKWF